MSNLRAPATSIGAKAIRKALGIGAPDTIAISDTAQNSRMRASSRALVNAIRRHHPERISA